MYFFKNQNENMIHTQKKHVFFFQVKKSNNNIEK